MRLMPLQSDELMVLPEVELPEARSNVLDRNVVLR
jgi:hypothetical protein